MSRCEEESTRSRDSFKSIDFEARNKAGFDVKELYSDTALFTYLKENKASRNPQSSV